MFIIGSLFATQTFAASPGDIVINEIAWMGTAESYSNEWVELYNPAQKAINLDDWVLRSTDGIPTVSLTGIIAANSYFLLERTDDNTVPTQTADRIYTGALGNSGEHLELVDNNGIIIDNVNSWGNWLAGDNTSKQTMERKNPLFSGSDGGNWAISVNVGGTPNAQNSVFTTPEPIPSPQNQIQEQQNNASASTTPYPTPEQKSVVERVVSSELIPSPSPTIFQPENTPTPESTPFVTSSKVTTPTPFPPKKKTDPIEKNVRIVSLRETSRREEKPLVATTSPTNTLAEAERQDADTAPYTASISKSVPPYNQNNQNFLTILTASFLVLFSAGFIFLLKRRLAK